MAVGGGELLDPCKKFDDWLNDKLSTDDTVFLSYIRSILEGEEAVEDKKIAIEDLLTGLVVENISALCQEILDKWTLLNESSINCNNSREALEDLDAKLARLMEYQARTATVNKNTQSAEQQRIKAAILQQYGQMSDDEDDEKGDENTDVDKNLNAALVAQAEKEKRERAKLESQRKKEKDKEDREKQKQMQQEKKEKRKTQKGERRR